MKHFSGAHTSGRFDDAMDKWLRDNLPPNTDNDVIDALVDKLDEAMVTYGTERQESGYEDGHRDGCDEGRDEGRDEGYEEGREDGYNAGHAARKAEENDV